MNEIVTYVEMTGPDRLQAAPAVPGLVMEPLDRDSPLITGLLAAVGAPYGWKSASRTAQDWRVWFAEAPERTFRLLSFEGEPAGIVTYKPHPGDEVEIGSFGLLPEFTGKGLDSYDAGKKKYVSVWVDNMITTPLVMEGSYDPEKKALTMSGPGAGPDGKPTTWKMVTTMADANAMNSAMYVGDQKEPAFTISYKRKK